MNQMKLVSLCLLFLLMALSSCGEETTGPAHGLGDQTISAVVDGVSWKPDQAVATYAGKTLNISSRRHTADGEELMEISIAGIEEPNSFQFGGPCKNSAHFRRGGIEYFTPLASVGCTGKVIITRLDAQRVAGTFEFVASKDGDQLSTRAVNITNGSFDLKVIPPP